MSLKIYGSITRDLSKTWQERSDQNAKLRYPVLPLAFYDMKLFPSRSQVYEMLHCASECSHRPNAEYITFGEFCVFASELKSSYAKHNLQSIPLSAMPNKTRAYTKRGTRRMPKQMMKCEVFLGGSCNPTTWRQDIAIPLLKSLGITYYNPQVTHWGPELIELESQAKQTAEVLFFVIDNQTRSAASILEAAHISGCRRKLILVIKPYEGPGQLILGEPISEREFQDLSRGQAILQDIVERQGIPVFENIHVALNCTAKLLREGLEVQALGLDDFVRPVQFAHVQLGDKLINLRKTFDILDTQNLGELTLADVCIAIKILTNRELSMEDLKAIISSHKKPAFHNIVEIAWEDIKVNFDQFCSIFVEFKEKVLQGLSFATSTPTDDSATGFRDVHLGGSCGLTTWREEIAIPMLKKSGLTYFNPQTSRWSERLIPIEAAALDNSRVLLFVITSSSRSVASMALAAHYIGLGCNVVLCIQYLPDQCTIAGDHLSQQAVKDYNRGRHYLSDLANREGLPVFEDIAEAVQCAIDLCKKQK